MEDELWKYVVANVDFVFLDRPSVARKVYCTLNCNRQLLPYIVHSAKGNTVYPVIQLASGS